MPMNQRSLMKPLLCSLMLFVFSMAPALAEDRFDLVLLNGRVMDPETTAHGPNEAMHLGVFKKAMLANVYLYDELGALPELIRS